MPANNQGVETESVRYALCPKGPLRKNEIAARERLRERLFSVTDAATANLRHANSSGLAGFVHAIVGAQQSLALLEQRAALVKCTSDAMGILLEAANVVDTLELDLLEFPLMTPYTCRRLCDTVRASVLTSFEARGISAR